MSLEEKELYEFGPFRLDVREHRFARSDGSSNGSLPEKAFQTLCVLVRNRGRLLTKQELMDRIWPDSFVEENNLDKCIHAIRQALGERPGEHRYIETVRKHGYRFVADVRKVGVTGGDAAEIDPRLKIPESGRQAIAPLSESRKVVKPPNAEQPRLISPLAIPGQRRKSWRPILAIGGALFLIGFPLVAVWLFPGGNSNSKKPGAQTKSMSSPAYDLYVRGKVKVASESREETEAAITILEEAVRLDPNFAEAYAELARGYNTLSFKYSSSADEKRFHENAEVAIEKALALKPDLAEGHLARGLTLWTNTERFPHEQAIQSYKRSISLDPNLDEAHHQLSLVYSHIGLLDEARRSVDKALEINPNNTLARFRVGVYLQYQGKFDDAIAVFKTIPRDHTPLLMDRSLAETLIQAGRLQEAEAIADDYLLRFPQDDGGSFTSVKALLLAKAGRQKEALEMIDRASRIGEGFGHFHHTAHNLAAAHAVMKNTDEAVKWLVRSAENGFPNHPYFELDPNLDNIRNDLRFVEFMTKLRPQWERFKAL